MWGHKNKLMEVQARLSNILKDEKKTSAEDLKVAISEIIAELDSWIKDQPREIRPTPGEEIELNRTTRSPLNPPKTSGPHRIDC